VYLHNSLQSVRNCGEFQKIFCKFQNALYNIVYYYFLDIDDYVKLSTITMSLQFMLLPLAWAKIRWQTQLRIQKFKSINYGECMVANKPSFFFFLFSPASFREGVGLLDFLNFLLFPMCSHQISVVSPMGFQHFHQVPNVLGPARSDTLLCPICFVQCCCLWTHAVG